MKQMLYVTWLGLAAAMGVALAAEPTATSTQQAAPATQVMHPDVEHFWSADSKKVAERSVANPADREAILGMIALHALAEAMAVHQQAPKVDLVDVQQTVAASDDKAGWAEVWKTRNGDAVRSWTVVRRDGHLSAKPVPAA